MKTHFAERGAFEDHEVYFPLEPPMIDGKPDSDETLVPQSDSTRPVDGLEGLIAECLVRLENDGWPAVEALLLQQPVHALAARAALAELEACGLLPGEKDTGDRLPEFLGPFRILHRLGGGGMGVVFVAEQAHLNRRVALKLIRPEFVDFAGARERLRREAEAVARLQHPGIVTIHMVGETGGRPWFAMEEIAGVSLADVLRAMKGRAVHELTGRDVFAALAPETATQEQEMDVQGVFSGTYVECIVRLLQQVAEALEHAHGRGILHRDVKPSNIMLTRSGRVVLIDFGLARASDATELTRTGSALGSLPYMAPEQIRGHREIDGRVDVYGLGVTLYEALTLSLPYSSANSEELRARILDGRPVSPRTLNSQLSRDAETLISTAISPEVHRRYRHAADMARDLGQLAEGRPIAARRIGWITKTRRYVQHRPWAGSTAVLGALLLFVVPLVLLHQSRQAAEKLRRERDTAIRARETAQRREATTLRVKNMLASFFVSQDPWNIYGRTLSAKEMVEMSIRGVRSRLAEEPVIRAELLYTLAKTCESLALYEHATDLLNEAAELVRNNSKDNPDLALQIQTARARWLNSRGQFAEALPVFAELQQTFRTPEISRESRVLFAIDHAVALLGTGQRLDALESARRAETLMQPVAGSPGTTRAALADFFGRLAIDDQRWAEAEKQFREACSQLELVHPPFHPRLLATRNNLALAIKMAGRAVEAAQVYQMVREALISLHGAEHDDVAIAGLNLASALEQSGDMARIGVLLDESVGVLLKLRGPDDPQVVSARAIRARHLMTTRRFADAAAEYDEIIPRQRNGITRDQKRALAFSLHMRGELFIHLRRPAEARPFLLESMAIAEEIQAGNEPSIIGKLRSLALAEEVCRNPDAALSAYHRALDLSQKLHGEKHRQTIEVQLQKIEFLTRRQATNEALMDINSCIPAAQELAGSDRFLLGSLLLAKASLLERTGKPAEILSLMDAALEVFRATLGEKDPETARCAMAGAMFARSKGEKSDAVDRLRRTIPLVQIHSGEEWQTRRDVLSSSLGALLVDLGRFAEARQELEALYSRIVDDTELSPSYKDALVTLILRSCEGTGDTASSALWRARLSNTSRGTP